MNILTLVFRRSVRGIWGYVPQTKFQSFAVDRLLFVAQNEHSSLIAPRGGALEKKKICRQLVFRALGGLYILDNQPASEIRVTRVTFVHIKSSGLDRGFDSFFKALFSRHWQVYFVFVIIVHLHRSGLFDFLF